MARSARPFPPIAHANPRRRSHAVARLQAERALLARYPQEYELLASRLGHVRATTGLVKRHAKEYGRLVAGASGIESLPVSFTPAARRAIPA
jgi:hypothetical protein